MPGRRQTWVASGGWESECSKDISQKTCESSGKHLIDSELRYKIDEDNLEKKLRDYNLFDSKIIHFEVGDSNPKNIIIWEQTPNHVVQILFMLKEESWTDDEWVTFDKQFLTDLVNSQKWIYKENNDLFGDEFAELFTQEIDLFIAKFCVEVCD